MVPVVYLVISSMCFGVLAIVCGAVGQEWPDLRPAMGPLGLAAVIMCVGGAYIGATLVP